MPGQRQWVLAARGTWQRIRQWQLFRQRRQCQWIRQRVLVQASHGMGAGLGQRTLQGGKARL